MAERDLFSKITNGVSLVLIPILVLIVSSQHTESIKDKDVHAKLVELAINILDKEPAKDDTNIRRWATEVIDKYSGVPFGASTKKDLIEKVPLNNDIPSFYKGIAIPKFSSGPLRIDSNVLAGENVSYYLSPNTDTAKNLNRDSVRAIIIHVLYGSVKGSLAWFKSINSHSSTHVVIGFDGKIYQIVPFNYKAYHSGRVVEKNNKDKIEVFKTSNGTYAAPNDASIAISLEGYGNSKFTSKQIEACKDVCFQIAKRYKIAGILNHSDINASKVCPGPNFPIEEIRKKVLGSPR